MHRGADPRGIRPSCWNATRSRSDPEADDRGLRLEGEREGGADASRVAGAHPGELVLDDVLASVLQAAVAAETTQGLLNHRIRVLKSESALAPGLERVHAHSVR